MKLTNKNAVKETIKFVKFLEDTLIPDLYESGYDATAEDFEKAVQLIRYWLDIGLRI